MFVSAKSVLVGVVALAAGAIFRQQPETYEINAGLSKTFESLSSPTSTAFSPDGRAIAALDKAGALHVVEIPAGSDKTAEATHKPGESRLAFSPIGGLLVSWGSDQQLRFWDPGSLTALKTIPLALAKPRAMAFSGDGTQIACGDDKGAIAIVSVASYATIAQFKAGGKVCALAFEPSGSSVVAITSDLFMRTWAIASPATPTREKKLPRMETYQRQQEPEYREIRSASCTPDGSLFAVGAYKWVNVLGGPPREYEFIVLYDRSGRRLLSIESVKQSLNMSQALCLSPDARLVAAQGANGSLRIWPVQQRGDPMEVPKVGTIRGASAVKRDGKWFFAVAANSAAVYGVSSPEAGNEDSEAKGEAISDGLAITFVNPAEAAPIVSSGDVEIAAVVDGIRDANPKWTIELAGSAAQPVALQPTDSRELVVAPAAEAAGSVGPPSATSLAPGRLRIAQKIALYPGPNRVKVAVRDGSRVVQLIKTICVVPEGELQRQSIYANSHAVVVGINLYQSGAQKIPDLKCAVADAEAVAAALADYGFPKENVTVLLDAKATRDAVMKALNRLADSRTVKPNDRVLVFFSGHGQTVAPPDGGQVGFLIPHDAKVDFQNLDNLQPYRDTCIRMSDLANLAADIPAKHVLFLLDACFSGLALNANQRFVKGTFKMPHEAFFDAKQVITASSRFETAKEAGSHGYFTKALLDSLSDKSADVNGDGYLTTSEIYDFVKPRVQAANSSQSPRLGKFTAGTGEMLFFK